MAIIFLTLRRVLLDWLAPAATLLGCSDAAAAMLRASPRQSTPQGSLISRGASPPTLTNVDIACRVAHRMLMLIRFMHELLQVCLSLAPPFFSHRLACFCVLLPPCVCVLLSCLVSDVHRGCESHTKKNITTTLPRALRCHPPQVMRLLHKGRG